MFSSDQSEGSRYRTVLLALFIGVEILILARFSLTGLRHLQNSSDAQAIASPSDSLATPEKAPEVASDETIQATANITTQAKATTQAATKAVAKERAIDLDDSDRYQQGLQQGYRAAVAVQQAKTKDQWQQARDLWEVAIVTLNQVPPGSDHHELAQTKVAEYVQNQTYAQQAAEQSQTALTQLRWDLGLIDPTQTLVRDIRAGVARGWIEATVSEGWYLHSRETRLATAQGLQQKWAALYSLHPDQSDAKIRLVTDKGKTVGISRRQGIEIEIKD